MSPSEPGTKLDDLERSFQKIFGELAFTDKLEVLLALAFRGSVADVIREMSPHFHLRRAALNFVSTPLSPEKLNLLLALIERLVQKEVERRVAKEVSKPIPHFPKQFEADSLVWFLH